MDLFSIVSVLIVLAAAFAYINHRYLKLPATIGLMFLSIVLSLAILLAGRSFPAIKNMVAANILAIDFSKLILEVMLCFMLFAGAIHIKYEHLKAEKFSIILYSTVSVVISCFLVGFCAQYVLSLFGIDVDFIQAMLFGALISPTDPISVLAILKKAGISKSLETKIAGESLFNDGVAVVIFITILSLATGNESFSFANTSILFGREAIGGLLLGLVFGWLGYKLLASIDNYQVETLITLAVVMGGYTFSHYLEISGPLAMVVAGLIIGNQGKTYGMSHITQEYIDKFWELLDEIFNAILFVLIGLELVIIDFDAKVFGVGIILIFVVLLIRFISVYTPSLLIRIKEKVSRQTLHILTWGGLRGGISIALALSIPQELNRDIWVMLTYVIVCFSILVQGLTVGKLASRLK